MTNISHILDLIISRQPQRILDVGTGHGKWALLLREYLPGGWTGVLHVDGVEKDKQPLISSGGARHYNSLYAHEFVKCMIHQVSKYDLVLLIDVLQEMDRKQGGQALLKALQLGDSLVISVPTEPAEGEARWTAVDFLKHLPNAWKEDELVVTNHSPNTDSLIYLVRKRHVHDADVASAQEEA